MIISLFSNYICSAHVMFVSHFGRQNFVLILVYSSVDFSGIATKDREWFFFARQERKHQNRNWMNRATKAGCWKSTGKDQEIYSGESLIGMKKILVFHIGRTSKGKGTCWVMHEYRTTLKEYDGTKHGQVGFLSPFIFCYFFGLTFLIHILHTVICIFLTQCVVISGK
jgi:hypothetical protein